MDLDRAVRIPLGGLGSNCGVGDAQCVDLELGEGNAPEHVPGDWSGGSGSRINRALARTTRGGSIGNLPFLVGSDRLLRPGIGFVAP